jgi:hypothetical protein
MNPQQQQQQQQQQNNNNKTTRMQATKQPSQGRTSITAPCLIENSGLAENVLFYFIFYAEFR